MCLFGWFQRVEELLLSIKEMVGISLEKETIIMSQYSDLAAQLNDATNAVAARIDKLIAAQTDPAVVAELTAVRDRLTALGADPSNPVPPE